MEKVAFLNFLHFPSHHASHTVSLKKLQDCNAAVGPNCKPKYIRPTSMLETGSSPNCHNVSPSLVGLNGSHFVKNSKRSAQPTTNRASKRASRTAKLLNLGSSFSFSTTSKSSPNPDHKKGQSTFFGLKTGGGNKENNDLQTHGVTGKSYSPNKDVILSPIGQKMPFKNSQNFKSGDVSTEFYENPSSWRHQVLGSLDMPSDHGHFRMLPEDSFRPFTPIIEVTPSSNLPKHEKEVQYQCGESIYEYVNETRFNEIPSEIRCNNDSNLSDSKPPIYQTITKCEFSDKFSQRQSLSNNEALNTARNRSPLSTSYDVAELIFSQSTNGTLSTQSIGDGAKLESAMEFGKYFDELPTKELISRSDMNLDDLELKYTSNFSSVIENNPSPCKSTVSCLWSPVSAINMSSNHATFKPAKSDSHLNYVVKAVTGPGSLDKIIANVFDLDEESNNEKKEVEGVREREIEAMARKYVKASKFYSLQGLRKLGKSKTVRESGRNRLHDGSILESLHEKSNEERNKSSAVLNFKGASASVASLNNIKTLAYRGPLENANLPRLNLGPAMACSKSMSKIFNAKKRGTFLPSLSSIFKPLTQHHNSPIKNDFDLEVDSSLDREVERDLAESVGRFEGNQAKARGRSTWTEKYRKMWLDEEYQRMKTNTQSAVNIGVHDTIKSPNFYNGCNGYEAGAHLALSKVLSEDPSDSINKNYPYIRMGIACHKFKSTESVTTSLAKYPSKTGQLSIANQPSAAKSTPQIAPRYFDKNQKLTKCDINSAIGTGSNDDRSTQCRNDQVLLSNLLYENVAAEDKCNSEENSNDIKCFDTILTSLDNILNAQITDKSVYNEAKIEDGLSLITTQTSGSPFIANVSNTANSMALIVDTYEELTQTSTAKITLPREDSTAKKHGIPASPALEVVVKSEEASSHVIRPTPKSLSTSISLDGERISGVGRQRYSSYLQDTASEWDEDNFERSQAKYYPTNQSKLGPCPSAKSPTSGGTVSFPLSKMATISELKNNLGDLTMNSNNGGEEPDANLLDLLSGMMRRKHNRQYAQSILCGQGKIFHPDSNRPEVAQPDNDSFYPLEKSTNDSIGPNKKKGDSLELDGHGRSAKRDSNCALNKKTSCDAKFILKKSATLDGSSPSRKTGNYYFPHIDVIADKSSPKQPGPELGPKPKINYHPNQPHPTLNRTTCEPPSPLYVKSYATKETVGCGGLSRSRYHRYYSNSNNPNNNEDKTTVNYAKSNSRYVKSNDPTPSSKIDPDIDKAKGPVTPSAPPSRSDSGYCSWDNGYDALPLLPQTAPSNLGLNEAGTNISTLAKNVGGSGDETTEEMDEESFGYCEDAPPSLIDDFPARSRNENEAMGRTRLGESTPSLTTTDNNSSIGSFPEHSDQDGNDPIYVNNNGGYAYKYATSPDGAKNSPSQGQRQGDEHGRNGQQAYYSPEPLRILPRLRHARPDIIPRSLEKTVVSQNSRRQSILLDQSSDCVPSKTDPLTPTQHYHVRTKSREEKDFETLSLEFSKMTTDPRILEVLVDPLSGWMEEAVVKLYALFGLPCYQNTLDALKQINEKAFVFNGLESRTSFDGSFIKGELLNGVNCMMNALKERQMAIENDIQSDDCKWQSIMADLSKVAKPNEVERVKQYFDDLEKIICLLLSLSLRITKTAHKLEFVANSKSSVDTVDKENLKGKSEKLIMQFNEAIKLKESIDKRGSNINTYFTNYSPHLDYEYFYIYSKTRAKLIIDKRHVIEKLKLGEEQIIALEAQQNL